ncbi:dynein axonemal intermediate chain 4-like isoform X2 [Physella acuta]|uniref:dynein axonemal intermediate chain 4-like isoform X2 n=1 Tax=Physella acuta TaxID=109671 RepID=UPI0027DDF131|nr:dynein axonemal intermediate chain 4-like isoform X2 [Physella acuta]
MSNSKNTKIKAGGGSKTNESVLSRNTSVSKANKSGGKNMPFTSVRSTVFSSASGQKKAPVSVGTDKPISTQKALVQIIDEAGHDVTPLPLIQLDPNAVKKNQSNVLGESSVGTPTDLMSQTSASLYGANATQTGTAVTSVYGGGPFTRSVFTQSYDTGSDSVLPDEMGTPDITTFSEVRHKRQEIQEIPTEEDLNKIVDITLVETETFWMIDLPDIKVSNEGEEAVLVTEANKKYSELVKSRVGNDLYVERGMNTFNEPPKLKSVHTTKIDTDSVSVECSNWDMYDTYDALEKLKKDFSEKSLHEEEANLEQEIEEELEDDIDALEEAEDEEGTISRPLSPKDDIAPTPAPVGSPLDLKNVESEARTAKKSFHQLEKSFSRNTSIIGSELNYSLEIAVELTPDEQLEKEWDSIIMSDEFLHHLFIMERIINLNTYQPKQALYRGFQPLTNDSQKTGASDSMSVHDVGPNLDRLWSYTCNVTKGRNISCMAWNRKNPDLLAVGYGQFEFTGQKPGIVCCWCLKNPEFPERVYFSKVGVTALDFSVSNPNFLAVGFYDGGIAVYNVRKSSLVEPVLDSFTAPGKHLAPVWQLRWIEKERGAGEESAEVLISISTDGRVTQWSIRKGFESYDVMKLKKMPTRIAGRAREKKGEAFISRFAGGMCFDFNQLDSNIYLAGTEDGFVHKCSCSHNEQYLESYQGHTGPVYSIQWSPFVEDIFLSCSADWTIKLWHQDKTRHILSFHSCTKAVNDICWSPWSSTVFACVNEGAVEVWDLAQSTLDPVYTITPTSGAKQTKVLFSKNSQCLLVGDSDGQVTVYQLRCMPKPPENQEEALKEVIKASLASQLSGATDSAENSEDKEAEDEEVVEEEDVE